MKKIIALVVSILMAGTAMAQAPRTMTQSTPHATTSVKKHKSAGKTVSKKTGKKSSASKKGVSAKSASKGHKARSTHAKLH